MKKLLLIVIPLLLIVGCSSPEPINYKESLNYRSGIYYTKDTNKPYSGPVFSLNDRGLNEIESILEDGKMTFYKEISWYYNYDKEQKEFEETYRNGEKNGLSTMWYENGQKKQEGSFKNGEPDGQWTVWYENGQKRSEITFKEGKQIALKTWNEDGSVKE